MSETPLACAKRQLAEAEDLDRRGVEDLSLPPPDDWRYEGERARKMQALRLRVVEAEAAERQRQQEAADEVVRRAAETEVARSQPVETPAAPARPNMRPASEFYEFISGRVGQMVGRTERELRAKLDGYLVAANERTATLEARVAELERRLGKLERRK